jgi:ABC-type transport system involved in Fe-S cluster assembly fused permease/ATPase subunit
MTTKIAVLLSIFPFALLIGSVAAFLLYVPVMTVAATAAILLALVLTFTLGVVAGGRRIRISRIMRRLQ